MASAEVTFEFEVEECGATAVMVRLRGELDIAGAPEFRDCLTALAPADIVIDMTHLTFLDCAGIGVLVGAHSRAVRHGRRLVLRNPQDTVARVLALSGVDEVLAIEAAGDRPRYSVTPSVRTGSGNVSSSQPANVVQQNAPLGRRRHTTPARLSNGDQRPVGVVGEQPNQLPG